MATITRTYLIDDLDGSQNDVGNVQFALDGTNYEIDLSASNAGRLRDKLARFVTAASPVNGAKSAPSRRGRKATAGSVASVSLPTNRDQVQAIREWAKAAGLEVSSRGRIAKAVRARSTLPTERKTRQRHPPRTATYAHHHLTFCHRSAGSPIATLNAGLNRWCDRLRSTAAG